MSSLDEESKRLDGRDSSILKAPKIGSLGDDNRRLDGEVSSIRKSKADRAKVVTPLRPAKVAGPGLEEDGKGNIIAKQKGEVKQERVVHERQIFHPPHPFKISVDKDFKVSVGFGIVSIAKWTEPVTATSPQRFNEDIELEASELFTIAAAETHGLWVGLDPDCLTDDNLPPCDGSDPGSSGHEPWSNWWSQTWKDPFIINHTTYTLVTEAMDFSATDGKIYYFIGIVSRAANDVVTITQKRKSDIYVTGYSAHSLTPHT
jgi:hypothetical protein